MKKILTGVGIILFIILIMLFNFFNSKLESTDIKKISDMKGKTIGIQRGTIYDEIIKDKIDNVKIKYYTTIEDLVEALEKKKIDGFCHDEPTIKYIMRSHDKIEYLTNKLNSDYFAYAINKNQKGNEILVKLNEYIDKINNDGTIQNLYNKWFGTDESVKETNDYTKLPNFKGKITLGVEEFNEPFVYVKDEKITGYEIDIITNFCKEYGYALDIKTYTFDELMKPSDKVDIRCSSISITDERKELFNFSKYTYENNGLIAVLKKDTKSEKNINSNDRIKKLEDLNGKKIGILTSTVFENITSMYISGGVTVYYDDNDKMFKDLSEGKIDGLVFDDILSKKYIREYDNLKIIDRLLSYDKYAIAFNKNKDKNLLHDFNKYLNDITKSGILDEYENKWLGEEEIKEEDIDLDLNNLKGTNGTIHALTMDISPYPVVYKVNDKYVGYEVEILYNFCKEYGYKLEIDEVPFNKIFDELNREDKYYDLLFGCITVNNERSLLCTFSNETYIGGVVSVVRDDVNNEKIN